jgi:hypothetical protein
VFDQAAMGSRSSERVRIEADLRKGLEQGELEVYYQPFFPLTKSASWARRRWCAGATP